MPINKYFKFFNANPNKNALVFEPSGIVVTYGDLNDNSNRLARLLRARGLQRGDHIALLMENHPRFIEVVLAAIRSGLYVTTVNRYAPVSEVAYIIDDCQAKAVVVSPLLMDVASQALVSAPKCVTHLMVDEVAPGFESYEQAILAYPSAPVDSFAGDLMCYSSGTSGRPKGIKRPLGEGIYYGEKPNAPPDVSMFGFNEHTVYLAPAPLYHNAPLSYILAALMLGAIVVVMEKFDPVLSLELIERHKVTHSQWVPTMFVRLLKLPKYERKRFNLLSHRCAIHGAAPCPIDVKREMITWWGPILEEYYAATERIGATTISSAEWLEHPGSVGRPIADAVVHICGEEGEKLPVGEPGLIYFQQKEVGFTYHNDSEKTKAGRHPQHSTWVTVGDVGRLDRDGYLYLTGRQSFMIISGGVNIYPQAIEDAFVMHPAVADVAVIGVPNPDMGEEVKAVVELRSGVSASVALASELIEFIRPKVARYAIPRSIDFIDQLPRLPTGKLYKQALRDSYWSRSATLI